MEKYVAAETVLSYQCVWGRDLAPPGAMEIKGRWGQGSGPCVRHSGGLQIFSLTSSFPLPGLLACADAFLWELSEKGNEVLPPKPPSWTGGI